NFSIERIERKQRLTLFCRSEQSGKIAVAIGFTQVFGAICESIFHSANLARESGHRNETRSDTPVLREENVVGPHRRAGRHRINGKRQFAKSLPQMLRHRPRVSASTDEKEIKALRTIEGGL